MSRRIGAWIGFGALVAASPAAAIALEDVLYAVEEHHPLVAAALNDRAAAGGERLAAEGAFDPVVKARAMGDWGYKLYGAADVWLEQPTTLWGTSLFGGYRVSGGELPIYEEKLETRPLGELRAGVAIPLWRNGPMDRRRAQIERFTLEERASLHAWETQILDLKRGAALRYWDWVAHGQRVAIAEQLLAIAEQRDGQLRDRAAAGDVAPIERVDNQRLLENRRNRLVSARRALEQAAIDLSLFLRSADGSPRVPRRDELPGELPEVVDVRERDASSLVRRALDERPELHRLTALRAQADVERRVADNQLAPAIDLTVQVSQDLGPGDVALGRPELEGGLLLDVPLPFRVARGRIGVAEAQWRKVGENLRWMRDRVAAEVYDALSALVAAEARVIAARKEIEAARSVEEAERTRLLAGDSSVLLVNLREQATADAQVVEVDALLDEHRAQVHLQAATGVLLGDRGHDADAQHAAR